MLLGYNTAQGSELTQQGGGVRNFSSWKTESILSYFSRPWSEPSGKFSTRLFPFPHIGNRKKNARFPFVSFLLPPTEFSFRVKLPIIIFPFPFFSTKKCFHSFFGMTRLLFTSPDDSSFLLDFLKSPHAKLRVIFQS